MSEVVSSTPASTACDGSGSSGAGTPAEASSTPSTPPVSMAPQQQVQQQQQLQQQMMTSPTQQQQQQQPMTPMAQVAQPQLMQHHQLQQLPQGNTVVRSSLPAQVQVIQPMGAQGGQLVYSSNLQQHLMLQNGSLQPVQLNQMGMQPGVSVSNAKSPGLISPGPHVSQAGGIPVNVSRAPVLQAKGTGVVQPQNSSNQTQATATPLYSQKQIIHRPAQPMVIGQIGVLSNNQLQMNSSKSTAITLQTTMPQSQQVISSPTQIRFTGHSQTFVTNTGQILGGNLNMNQFQQFQGFPQQGIPAQVMGSQNATILTTQPLYLRPAGTLHHGIVQAVAPTKGKPRQQEPKALARMPHTSSSSSSSCSSTVSSSTSPLVSQGDSARVRGLVHHPKLSTAENSLLKMAQPQQQMQQMRPMAFSHGMTPASPMVQVHGVQTGQPKGVANILPQGTRAVGPNGQHIQLQQVAPSGVHLQPQLIKTIQPLPQAISQQQQQQQQQAPPKQVSKVRAMKVQPKPQSPVPQGTVRPSQVRPNPRPLMLVVQPKQQTPPKPEEPKDSQPSAAAAASASSSTSSATNPAGAQPSLVPPTEIKVEEMDTSESPPDTAAASAQSTDAPAEPAVPARVEKQTGLVKPNVLTHVIEGFVIQEAPEPFPVERSHVLHDLMSLHNGSDCSDSESGDKMADGKQEQTCEFCGRIDRRVNFTRSRRFCSLTCAKRYNVSCTKRMGLFHSKGTPRSSMPFSAKKKSSSTGATPTTRKTWKQRQQDKENPDVPAEPTPTPSESSSPPHVPASVEDTASETDGSMTPSAPDTVSSVPRSPPELEREGDMEGNQDDMAPPPPTMAHPSRWNVQDVYEFISTLHGCESYADEFRSQEIDGQALMLLKEDHLMTAMNLKLGPALKICARINTLKDELS